MRQTVVFVVGEETPNRPIRHDAEIVGGRVGIGTGDEFGDAQAIERSGRTTFGDQPVVANPRLGRFKDLLVMRIDSRRDWADELVDVH